MECAAVDGREDVRHIVHDRTAYHVGGTVAQGCFGSGRGVASQVWTRSAVKGACLPSASVLAIRVKRSRRWPSGEKVSPVPLISAIPSAKTNARWSQREHFHAALGVEHADAVAPAAVEFRRRCAGPSG